MTHHLWRCVLTFGAEGPEQAVGMVLINDSDCGNSSAEAATRGGDSRLSTLEMMGKAPLIPGEIKFSLERKI